MSGKSMATKVVEKAVRKHNDNEYLQIEMRLLKERNDILEATLCRDYKNDNPALLRLLADKLVSLGVTSKEDYLISAYERARFLERCVEKLQEIDFQLVRQPAALPTPDSGEAL